MRTHLTERVAKALRVEGRRNVIVHDETVSGFGLRATPAGAKSFVLWYRIAGRERRMTIGAWPDWSCVAAREEAKRLKREVDRGCDPLAERMEMRAAPSMADLVERYLAEHGPSLAPRNAADQRSMLHKIVLPEWGARKAADITASDVDRLLSKMAAGRARPAKAKPKRKRSRPLAPPRPTPVRANRLGEILRKMFNLAVRWGIRPDNPATGFARRPEYPRERYLDPGEIGRLADALSAHPDQRAANVIRLILLTGARRGEALNARWEQFDLDRGVWVKPAATTKQRRMHRTPLSRTAVALLATIRAGAPQHCPWVFPGDAPGKPLQEVRGLWAAVTAEAGLTDVRIHDLRHTFASLLVSGGMSLPMIGRLLGHTQVQTTQRYAHLADDPLRAGLDTVGDMLRPRLRIVEPDGESRKAGRSGLRA
jgi:integrase